MDADETLKVEVLVERYCPRYGAIEKGIQEYPTQFAKQLIRQGIAKKAKESKPKSESDGSVVDPKTYSV